jgi:hypothetical protein
MQVLCPKLAYNLSNCWPKFVKSDFSLIKILLSVLDGGILIAVQFCCWKLQLQTGQSNFQAWFDNILAKVKAELINTPF